MRKLVLITTCIAALLVVDQLMVHGRYREQFVAMIQKIITATLR